MSRDKQRREGAWQWINTLIIVQQIIKGVFAGAAFVQEHAANYSSHPRQGGYHIYPLYILKQMATVIESKTPQAIVGDTSIASSPSAAVASSTAATATMEYDLERLLDNMYIFIRTTCHRHRHHRCSPLYSMSPTLLSHPFISFQYRLSLLFTNL
jgi:hypothetical protein